VRADGEPLAVSLVTGEERRLAENATHVASTVEMLDTKTRIEVAVIDEIQMLADRDRGAAWTAAVCGAPASTVYLVGAPEARRAIEALAERLECPLEVHVLKRKAPLTMEPGAVRKIRNLRRGDAVIAFSRRNVLMWRDMITEMGLSVATVYGNLSPEVRRAQAERFREGQADIVVGTDAIAMGLNMPIQRIVMTTAVKYNGVEEEEISAALAKQIAGRAGPLRRARGRFRGRLRRRYPRSHALADEGKDPAGAGQRLRGGAFARAIAPHLVGDRRNLAGQAAEALRAQHRRAGRLLLSAITEEQNERAEWLDTAGPERGREIHDVAGADLDPGAVAGKRLDALGAGAGEAQDQQADAHPQKLFWLNLQEVEDTCRMYSAYAWLRCNRRGSRRTPPAS
jgi:ATP-dependent RNA helicase SUPV3L1/SUV3